MKRSIAGIIALAAVLAVGTAAAVEAASTRGEVLEVRHGVSVPDQGEFDRLTIRTRNGENRDLLLGPSGSCQDCVRVGDRIRARVMAEDSSGPTQRVREMRVRRTGETISFRNENGDLIRERARRGDGTAAGSTGGRGGQGNQARHQGHAGSGAQTRSRSCGGGRR
jgi:hypothetical protein